MKRSYSKNMYVKIIAVCIPVLITALLCMNYKAFFMDNMPEYAIRKYYEEFNDMINEKVKDGCNRTWNGELMILQKEYILESKEIAIDEEQASVVKNQIIRSIRDKVPHEGNWIDKTDCVSEEDIKEYEVKLLSGTEYVLVYRNNYDDTKDKWIVYGTSHNRESL